MDGGRIERQSAGDRSDESCDGSGLPPMVGIAAGKSGADRSDYEPALRRPPAHQALAAGAPRAFRFTPAAASHRAYSIDADYMESYENYAQRTGNQFAESGAP